MITFARPESRGLFDMLHFDTTFIRGDDENRLQTYKIYIKCKINWSNVRSAE